jgi:hypothetical protein
MERTFRPYIKRYFTWKDYQMSLFYLLGGVVLMLVLLYIIKNIFREHLDKPAVLDDFFKKPAKLDKVAGESKGETLCRDIAQKVFGKPFVKVRPKFLKNEVTGKNLELDIYNEDIKVAIEFNGRQHYEFVPFFHKNYEDFLTQRYRDEMKKAKCKDEGIHLIEIRYDATPTDIESQIRLEAMKLGLAV